jgi:hypothetical protein
MKNWGNLKENTEKDKGKLENENREIENEKG